MRRLLALLGGVASLCATPAAAVPGTWTLVGVFTPQVDLYTTAGAHTETIPTGPTQMITEDWGGGGGGGGATLSSNSGAGGSGAYNAKTFTLAPTDWGKTLICTVGANGVGGATTSTNGTAGGATTIVNGTYSTSVSFSAAGGGLGIANGAGGAGGTPATGGTTNTTGNAGTSAQPGIGGAAIVGVASAAYGYGGGGGLVSGGQNGGVGACSFRYSGIFDLSRMRSWA